MERAQCRDEVWEMGRESKEKGGGRGGQEESMIEKEEKNYYYREGDIKEGMESRVQMEYEEKHRGRQWWKYSDPLLKQSKCKYHAFKFLFQ